MQCSRDWSNSVESKSQSLLPRAVLFHHLSKTNTKLYSVDINYSRIHYLKLRQAIFSCLRNYHEIKLCLNIRPAYWELFFFSLPKSVWFITNIWGIRELISQSLKQLAVIVNRKQNFNNERNLLFPVQVHQIYQKSTFVLFSPSATQSTSRLIAHHSFESIN